MKRDSNYTKAIDNLKDSAALLFLDKLRISFCDALAKGEWECFLLYGVFVWAFFHNLVTGFSSLVSSYHFYVGGKKGYEMAYGWAFNDLINAIFSFAIVVSIVVACISIVKRKKYVKIAAIMPYILALTSFIAQSIIHTTMLNTIYKKYYYSRVFIFLMLGLIGFNYLYFKRRDHIYTR
ncbi:MAG: hypothetical protein J5802_06150 [Butyrivibrio sp.]|nr:hypothetical protein [Butyrivibrio sp.]